MRRVIGFVKLYLLILLVYGMENSIPLQIPFPWPPSLRHLTKPLHTKPFHYLIIYICNNPNIQITLFSCILVINKTVFHLTCVVVFLTFGTLVSICISPIWTYYMAISTLQLFSHHMAYLVWGDGHEEIGCIHSGHIWIEPFLEEKQDKF